MAGSARPRCSALEDGDRRARGRSCARCSPPRAFRPSPRRCSLFVAAGDHLLVTDSVYRPTRRFCDEVLKRLGVETTYYDPLLGAGIEDLISDNTRMSYSPSRPARRPSRCRTSRPSPRPRMRAAPSWCWTTPGRRRSSSSRSLMAPTCRSRPRPNISSAMPTRCSAPSPQREPSGPRSRRAHEDLGLCAGPEDVYLGLRGLAQPGRPARAPSSARRSSLPMAGAAAGGRARAAPRPSRRSRPRALEPRLHRRLGLFAIVLKPVPKAAVAAMLDGLELVRHGL